MVVIRHGRPIKNGGNENLIYLDNLTDLGNTEVSCQYNLFNFVFWGKSWLQNFKFEITVIRTQNKKVRWFTHEHIGRMVINLI